MIVRQWENLLHSEEILKPPDKLRIFEDLHDVNLIRICK